jgi:dihydrodipicolinate synthase/N-acetylneuraminate lyase
MLAKSLRADVAVINCYATASTNLPAMKSIMKLLGLDCGPLRLPLPSLTELQGRALSDGLQNIGFFEWGV